jgi:UDP-glucose 4-epimerase
MKVLITGGAGYIGSHTCIELIMSGYQVVVIDSLYSSSLESLRRVEKITGAKITFIKMDLRDRVRLERVFEFHSIDSVVHFCGLKSVSESVESPIEYYDVNVGATFILADVMRKFNCKKLVFSSSATVYGDPEKVPINEQSALSVKNPYGRSKLMAEDFFRDLHLSDSSWSVGLLRYFNPVGAHESGLIGEDPNAVPNNLMPYISQVAVGRLKELSVFGDDYDTPDGTGVRDYIHVVDLAKAHVKALSALSLRPQLLTVNVGTGKGYSVLEIIKAFEKASGKIIPYRIVGRRSGDVAVCYADPSYAHQVLGWESKFDLDQMCKDTWGWQRSNPDGYSG